MSVFKEIEKKEDQANAARRLRDQANSIKTDKLVACSHRRPTGFYDVRCAHPERQSGRQCIGLDCPVIE